ncbi:hypothetical protein Lesp01_44410 [Lentzea sp. NBRC 102530]|nr:hypothetical protein Lesp01_44410 [Lentzea sp. NBRC 102530]
MTGVDAYWALLGKRPGSYEEYGVLAASREPFTHSSLRQIVIDRAPADQSVVQESGPGAMPWAWFSTINVESTRYVCLTISTWSDALDAINRPIVVSRFYCVRTDDLIAARLSYADFYRAAENTPLSEQLPSGPVPLNPVPARQREPLPDGHAMAAAAGLLERQRVGLLSGPVSLDERIAVLDDVLAFLPAGARAWVSAGGWTDTSTRYPLRLAFAPQVPDTALGINVQGAAPRASGAYGHQLTELVGQYGAAKVRAHLATMTTVRTRDLDDVLAALQDMDQENLLFKAATTGRLTVGMLRRLGAARFRGMADDQRETILASYLELASAEDLRRDRALLVETWRYSLDRNLEDLVRQRVSQRAWTIADLLVVADICAAVGARQAFAGALRSCASERNSSSLREVVMRLASDDGWSEALVPVITQSDQLSVAVLRAALPDGSGVNPRLLAGLEDHPNSSWSRYGRPYLRPENLSEQNLSELHSIDPEAVTDVMRHARKTAEPGWWPRVLGWFLDLVRRCNELVRSWVDLLRHGLEPMEPAERARADFELCRRGEAPGQNLGLAGVAYWDGLVEAARAAHVDGRQRQVLGDTLASALGRDWGAESGRFFAVMDGLWRLSAATGGGEVLTVTLLRSIAGQIRGAPERLDDGRLAEWLPFFALDPELHSQVLMAQLRGVKENAAPANVAVLVATILHRKVVGENDVLEVLRRIWCPPPYGWVEFLAVLNARLAGMGDFKGPQICAKFVHALMRGDFGEDAQQAAIRQLPAYMMQQGYLTVEVFREAFRATQASGRGEDLALFLEDLVKRVKDVMPKGMIGRIFGRGEGSRDHH